MWILLFWIVLFTIGYAIIYFAADLFIDNLKELCILSNISPFIVGLVVFGIDPEESIASIVAAMNNLPYLAVGNVIGNSIISVSLCFALPALVYEIDLKSVSQFYFVVIYINLGLILIGCIFNFGLLFTGILALLLYIFYLVRSIRHLSKDKVIEIIDMEEIIGEIEDEKVELEDESKIKKIIIIILSFALIILGGELLVISAEQIIELTLLPEDFFGFIIIAFVTNVEELTLIFKAIKKKSVEIGLGAMIGKIIWNLAFTYGVSGIIALNIVYNWTITWNWLILFIIVIYFNLIARNKAFGKKQALILIFIFIIFIFINLITIGG